MKEQKNLVKQIMSFTVVGFIAFLIDYSFLYVFKEIININLFISIALAFLMSVIFNYLASIKYVFKVKRSKKNFILFVILSTVGLLLTELIMFVCVNIIGINYLIAKIFATIIVMIFNFVTRKVLLER